MYNDFVWTCFIAHLVLWFLFMHNYKVLRLTLLLAIFYKTESETSGLSRFETVNLNWHVLRKQDKCSSLAPPRNKFYKTQWAWQGVKLTQLMAIFTSKKVWKFLIQIQLKKSNRKITRGVKVPCLMPIRVKSSWISGTFSNYFV